MNLYLYFVSFFVFFFINYSNSACMGDSSPISSPKRINQLGRARSPEKGLMPMDLEEGFRKTPITPRILLDYLEDSDSENSDAEHPELQSMDNGLAREMPFPLRAEPEIQIPVMANPRFKRAGDKLESYPKRSLLDGGDVIYKLHKAEKPFLHKIRSISTSPKRKARLSPLFFATP